MILNSYKALALIGYIVISNGEIHARQIKWIDVILHDEELDLYKWGRNAHGGKAKNADIVTYRMATGLETLLGVLYQEGKIDRVSEIINFIVGE